MNQAGCWGGKTVNQLITVSAYGWVASPIILRLPSILKYEYFY